MSRQKYVPINNGQIYVDISFSYSILSPISHTDGKQVIFFTCISVVNKPAYMLGAFIHYEVSTLIVKLIPSPATPLHNSF